MWSLFRTMYRIVKDRWAGYEVQQKIWWLGSWHMPSSNTHQTLEEAEAYIEKIKFVKYVD